MEGRVGPYEILGKIGQGGMGAVWEARDTRLGRMCALKFVAGEDRSGDLLVEARAASALNHPNIVTVYDFGQHGGQEFIVMERVQGRSLSDLLRSKILGPETTFEYGAQVAEGLCAAHAAGIVHRDLKPGNIMITPEGRVKILDFGLARPEVKWDLDALVDQASNTSEPRLSEEPRISGTLAYMSPEQAIGLPVDARTDQFALGCVLYECLTQRRAFAAIDPSTTLHNLLTRQPPPIPDLPAAAMALIQRCLQKKPADRYPSMADLLAAIQQARSQLAAGPLIAVLPFSGVPHSADTWFAEGLSDEIAFGLSRLQGLRVLARTSSGILSQTPDDLYAAAHRLGVNKILEGRVQASGDRLRVTAALLDVPSGARLWTERFDRPLADLFELQDDIARAVVAALRVQILAAPTTPIVPAYGGDLEIRNLYLQGHALAERYGDKNVVRGISLLEEVVRRAPEHAAARAALGIAFSHAAHAGVKPPADLVPAAVAHLRSAVALDPGLAEAWAQLGLLQFGFERDPAAAERSFHRGLETNSRDPFACSLYAICFLAPLGGFDLALEFARKAVELDPLSPVHHLRQGWVQVFAGRNAESLDSFERCLTFGPLTFSAHLGCAIALHQSGDHPGALRRVQAAIQAWPEQPESTAWKAFFLGLYGQSAEASQVLQELHAMAASTYVSPLLFAYAAIGFGDFDNAFAQLDLAFDAGEIRLIYINDFPFPEPFRSDSRFHALLRRCGLLFGSPSLNTLTQSIVDSRLAW